MNAIKLVAGTALLALALTGCEKPVMEAEQLGYRGVGMEQVINPRIASRVAAANVAPDPLPQVPPGGPKAGDIYENVQVLGHLDVGEFTRLMAAMTEWVSPQEGCNYCHEAGNFAAEGVYTKTVSRRMIQMTQHVNAEWQDHVADTGVTCYTCHRGQPVPENIWFEDKGPHKVRPMMARNYGQNLASEAAVYSSLPRDPFSPYIEGDASIRVIAQTALPTGQMTASTQDTEGTYALMMHLSDSLGVNCTFCHNSRAFSDWAQSPPARVSAWHGLQMVRSLNNDYLVPLQGTYPEHRLGANGDAPKANCATCHNGVSKPLNGAQMLVHYTALAAPGMAAAPATPAAPATLRQAIEQVIEAAEGAGEELIEALEMLIEEGEGESDDVAAASERRVTTAGR